MPSIRDEFLKEDLKENKALENEIRTTYIQATNSAVDQLRRWIIETITISSTILGAFIAISATKSELIKNPILIQFALFLILILIGFAIIYVKNALFKDIRGLISQSGEYLDYLSSLRILKTKFLIENNPEYLKELKTKEDEYKKLLAERASKPKTPDHSYNIITWLFLFVLFLIFCSMVDSNIFITVIMIDFNISMTTIKVICHICNPIINWIK